VATGCSEQPEAEEDTVGVPLMVSGGGVVATASEFCLREVASLIVLAFFGYIFVYLSPLVANASKEASFNEANSTTEVVARISPAWQGMLSCLQSVPE